MNKTNKEIIDKRILNDKKIMKTFYTISRGSKWQDDLLSHIILQYMEMDNTKLNKLDKRPYNEFRYYFSMLVKNQLHSSTSSFYNIYRKHSELSNEISSDFNPEDDYNEEEYTEKIPEWYTQYETILDTLHWYDATLFRLYVDKQGERGPIERISEETKIPRQSIGHSIRNTKAILKKNLKL